MCLSCHILLVVLERSVLVDREEQGHRMCEGVRCRLLQAEHTMRLKSSAGLAGVCYCELGLNRENPISIQMSCL